MQGGRRLWTGRDDAILPCARRMGIVATDCGKWGSSGMRLICPNCDAEYEVDDAAIPDTGRDVQCSNCGHAWFQLPPEIELALEQEEELFGKPDAADPLPDLDDLTPDTAQPAPAMAEPQRRSVDENLLAILREEAEREAAARRAEAAPIETQPDLGLGGAAAKAAAPSATAQRIADLRGQPPEPATPARSASRRDLLPDIEEINSSLKGSDAQPAADLTETGDDAAASQGGFRRGFTLSLTIAVLGAAIYVSAPQIGAYVPAAQAPLQSYVGGVDAARLWLDGAMRAATEAVRDLAQQGGAPTAN